MAADFLRDGLVVFAWFGLMAFVWLGWAQEDPPPGTSIWLGLGSGVGLLAAVGGGLLVWQHWDSSSALDGQYASFGLLVGAEVLLAGLSCLVLWRLGRTPWFSVGVAVVVALHFVPLGLMLSDPALVALGVVQVTLVIAAARVAHARQLTPSFAVGVAMGATLLAAAAIAAAVWVPDALR